MAVLRNSLSAVSTLWTSLQLAWCWRAIADGCLARTLPTIIFAISTFCAFTIAGGFTSTISSGIGNDVLINNPQCAVLSPETVSVNTLSEIFPYISQSLNDVANYAQQCYSLNTTGTLDCTTFVKSHLDFSSSLNASCPFSGNICRSNDSGLLLDSGLVSSDDLGLNMPSSQRIYYREVLQCAPLRTDGFTSRVRTDYDDYIRYLYGDYTSQNTTSYNWTYQVESLQTKYVRQSDNPVRMNSKGFNV